MRIALVNNTFEPFQVGGAEKSMLARAKGLAARGHVVRIFTLAADGHARIRELDDIPIVYFKGRWAKCSPWHEDRTRLDKFLWHAGPEWVPGGGTDISVLIEDFAADVVNFANLPGIGYENILSVRKAGIPTVMTIADFAPLCIGTTMFRSGTECWTRCLSCRLISSQRLRRFNLADRYVFVSRHMQDTYHRLNPGGGNMKSNSHIIFNGLDKTFLEAGRQVTGRSHEGLRIGFMGQLKPTKGVELLIRQFLASGVSESATLRIAGVGEETYTNHLQELAKGSDRIEFLGWSDPITFYRSVDLVVVPSLWAEPLPRIGYEANYCGLPVIVSNRGGCPELVETNKTGSVFDPDDPNSLSREMFKWIERLQGDGGEIGLRAKHKALRDHHPEVVADRYEQVLTF